MEFIIGVIILLIILFFVNQSNNEKRKIKDEEKRLALIQQKKLEEKRKIDEVNRLEKIRLQKIEDEKYETFTIVVIGQNNGKYTCVLKRQNNTYAYVGRPETAFKLNSTIKLLKDKATDFEWISETQHNEKQKEAKEQNERQAEITRQNALQEIETRQRNFYETNTSYTIDLLNIYKRNPRNFGLTTIKSLSTPYYNSIKEEEQNQFFAELNQGVAILQKEGHLFIYMRSYGNMHQAKLLQSFEAIPNLVNKINRQDIQIIDYGCGQGIGSIVFIDYLKSINANNFIISKVKLIEPSELALKRASLNVKYSLKSISQNENVLSIHKTLDNISIDDISTNSQSIKFHIFSNIVDVESIDIKAMCAKIEKTQKGENYFICVSPKFWDDGIHPRNERQITFMNYFKTNNTFVKIQDRVSDIPNPSNPAKPYKRFERVFKLTM